MRKENIYTLLLLYQLYLPLLHILFNLRDRLIRFINKL